MQNYFVTNKSKVFFCIFTLFTYLKIKLLTRSYYQPDGFIFIKVLWSIPKNQNSYFGLIVKALRNGAADFLIFLYHELLWQPRNTTEKTL